MSETKLGLKEENNIIKSFLRVIHSRKCRQKPRRNFLKKYNIVHNVASFSKFSVIEKLGKNIIAKDSIKVSYSHSTNSKNSTLLSFNNFSYIIFVFVFSHRTCSYIYFLYILLFSFFFFF